MLDRVRADPDEGAPPECRVKFSFCAPSVSEIVFELKPAPPPLPHPCAPCRACSEVRTLAAIYSRRWTSGSAERGARCQ